MSAASDIRKFAESLIAAAAEMKAAQIDAEFPATGAKTGTVNKAQHKALKTKVTNWNKKLNELLPEGADPVLPGMEDEITVHIKNVDGIFSGYILRPDGTTNDAVKIVYADATSAGTDADKAGAKPGKKAKAAVPSPEPEPEQKAPGDVIVYLQPKTDTPRNLATLKSVIGFDPDPGLKDVNSTTGVVGYFYVYEFLSAAKKIESDLAAKGLPYIAKVEISPYGSELVAPQDFSAEPAVEQDVEPAGESAGTENTEDEVAPEEEATETPNVGAGEEDTIALWVDVACGPKDLDKCKSELETVFDKEAGEAGNNDKGGYQILFEYPDLVTAKQASVALAFKKHKFVVGFSIEDPAELKLSEEDLAALNSEEKRVMVLIGADEGGVEYRVPLCSRCHTLGHYLAGEEDSGSIDPQGTCSFCGFQPPPPPPPAPTVSTGRRRRA